MKLMHKSNVGLAVAAAIGIASLAPSVSYGWAVDVLNNEITSDSGADTLLFPFYSTALQATTSFSTTNTGDRTIVAKIRFREQEHSMDVLDFIVVYSPYDKFDFDVTQGVDQPRPTMRWNDNTCVVGPDSSGVQTFPPPSAWVETDEQMSVGHVEMLGMADITNTCFIPRSGDTPASATDGKPCTAGIDLAAAALHGSNGEPADCGVLAAILASPTAVAALNTVHIDVPNDLIGRYVVTGSDGGIEAGSDAIAIANSDFPMMTAQSSAACMPDNTEANCTQSYDWDGREWDHPHLGEMEGLSNFQELLSAAAVAGDWSNNTENHVGVSWVVSFPSKYAYLDYINCDDSAGKEWCLLPAALTGYGLADIWTNEITPDRCLGDNESLIFDTEEQAASGNVTVSPGSETTLDICNELNVLTFAAEGTEPRTSVIQTAERRQVVEFSDLDAVRGWAILNLSWATMPGGAVNALNFTTRATADPAFNNGSITTLQKFQP